MNIYSEIKTLQGHISVGFQWRIGLSSYKREASLAFPLQFSWTNSRKLCLLRYRWFLFSYLFFCHHRLGWSSCRTLCRCRQYCFIYGIFLCLQLLGLICGRDWCSQSSNTRAPLLFLIWFFCYFSTVVQCRLLLRIGERFSNGWLWFFRSRKYVRREHIAESSAYQYDWNVYKQTQSMTPIDSPRLDIHVLVSKDCTCQCFETIWLQLPFFA